METSTNKPYVKRFNNQGFLINPIEGAYMSTGINRKERRKYLNEKRFNNNRNSFHLTVLKTGKYYRILQRVFNKKQKKVVSIEHYILNK